MVLTEAVIKLELARIMEAPEVDEDKLKDLEKRVMEFVETDQENIDPYYIKLIQYLKMDKRLKSMIKVTGTSTVKKKDDSSSQ